MDFTAPYCMVIRATDEVASLQLQTVYWSTVSTEGSEQLSSGNIPHLAQRIKKHCTALHYYNMMHYKSNMPSSLESITTYPVTLYKIITSLSLVV